MIFTQIATVKLYPTAMQNGCVVFLKIWVTGGVIRDNSSDSDFGQIFVSSVHLPLTPAANSLYILQDM